MHPTTLRLDESDKQDLRRLGVTDAQVRRLDRKLPSIARALAGPASKGASDAEKRPARNEVLEVLAEAEATARRLVRIADAASLPANREALAHLASASALVEAEQADGSGDDTLPEVPDFAAAARMLMDMARKAKAEVPKGQRRGRRDPGRAVAMLLAALGEPDGAESRALAKRAKPVRAESRRNPFGGIVRVVFGRAAGMSYSEMAEIRAAVDAWHKRPMKGVEMLPTIAMPKAAVVR